jgi:hypothetical protein
MRQSCGKLTQDRISASPVSGKRPDDHDHPQKKSAAKNNCHAPQIQRRAAKLRRDGWAIFKAKTSAPPSGHHLRSRGRGDQRTVSQKIFDELPGPEDEGGIKNEECRMKSGAIERGTFLRPIVAMLKLVQIRRAKCPDEILDEFILRFLFQRHAEQFEFCGRLSLANIVGETKIARETDREILDGKLVKSPVVQALHSQGDDRLDFMAFRAQGGDELAWQILVQQDFHAGCNSF